MSELTDALDTLADMFEYGHLQAQTDPAGFIKSVQDRIQELEAALEKIANYAKDRPEVSSTFWVKEMAATAEQALKGGE